MRYVMVGLVSIAVLMTGCATQQGYLTGKVAQRVCELDEPRAMVLRQRVDQVAHPHKVRIECADEIEGTTDTEAE